MASRAPMAEERPAAPRRRSGRWPRARPAAASARPATEGSDRGGLAASARAATEGATAARPTVEERAREYEEQSKPITRYFQMMNEIVEDASDVRILRRAGVVRGGSSGAQEVHDLIKNIDGHATYPSVYMAMDREIDMVREYHDQRMANFFVRNRPGVIWASSVAAISVAAIVAMRRIRG